MALFGERSSGERGVTLVELVCATAIVLVLALAATGWWLWRRNAQAHWARTVAAPEVQRLGESGEFSAALGRPISYIGVTIEQAEAAMKSRGMPDWLVTHLVSMAKAGNDGAFSHELTQPIRDIVGREPYTTRQFIEAYKGAFS